MVMKSLKTYILVRNLFKISFVEIIKLGLVNIKFSLNLCIRSSKQIKKTTIINRIIDNKQNELSFLLQLKYVSIIFISSLYIYTWYRQ